jgi:ATP-dependent DNA helicase RecG
MELSTSIESLFGVGEKFAKLFDAKLGIKTVGDLLNHFPQRYEDYSNIKPFSDVKNGEIVTVIGKINDVKNIFTYRIKIQRIVISDVLSIGEDHSAEITFFNQPFLLQSLRKDMVISVSGTAERSGQKLQFKSPEYEIIKFPINNICVDPLKICVNQKPQNGIDDNFRSQLVHTGRLTPIYPETQGISSKRLRALIFPLLHGFDDFFQEYLPENLRHSENLIEIITAYKNIHYPESHEQLAKANFRLAFDELLIAELQALDRKKYWGKETAAPLSIEPHQKLIQEFIKKLPFTLTNSQNHAIEEIFSDLIKNHPMNRLLEGDVGSGKTVVAAAAMYLSYLNGYSCALMCPTEILANQHYATINNLLSKFKVPICLVTSTTKTQNAKLKTQNHSPRGEAGNSKLKTNKNICVDPLKICVNPGVYIGTHALIQDNVNIAKLNLVVIDEQHRFGVEQRGKLVKKGTFPHVLTMTATPIPRTIALTFYGDLDLSALVEMPQKKQIKTWVVPHEKRENAYEWIRAEILKNKSQVFIVCPFISPSETMESVKSATTEFEKLRKIFIHLKLELLTGKTRSKEKDQIMKSFEKNEFDILVCTPVVEVGIDIPHASIILVEGAERFGLAQLHQLRGRVGRRGQPAYCLLFTTEYNPESTRRLKSMETVDNGLKLAEIDLKIRGMGNIFGKEQHGILEFKKADISDLYMVEKTKKVASQIFDKIDDFPILKKRLENSKIENIVNN